MQPSKAKGAAGESGRRPGTAPLPPPLKADGGEFRSPSRLGPDGARTPPRAHRAAHALILEGLTASLFRECWGSWPVAGARSARRGGARKRRANEAVFASLWRAKPS
eukprot:2003516-Pyramimonas_sp.AAC.1